MSDQYIPVVIEKYNLAMLALETISSIEFYPDEHDNHAKNIVNYAKTTLKQINNMEQDNITDILLKHRNTVRKIL